MAQEKHLLTTACYSSAAVGAGGVNKSKTAKQKKVPQRGLGVAQLEKIRMEEQRKREALQAANALANNAIGGSVPNDASQCLAIQCPNLGYSAPTSVYKSAGSIPLCVAKLSNDGGGEIGFPEIVTSSRLWRGEMNHEVAILPPPQSYQLQPPSSTVVNASSEASTFQVLSSHMEPPSNQSLCSKNSTPPSWPEEEKMVGMKRSYPFSLESPPVPSVSSCSSGSASQVELRYKYIRDSPSNSNSLPEQKPNHAVKDAGRLGDFLRLAPPTAAFTPLNSKEKHASDYSRCQGLQTQKAKYVGTNQQKKRRSPSSQPDPKSSETHGKRKEKPSISI